MSYAIIGFGKIGEALAHAFARKNIDVIRREPPATRGVGSRRRWRLDPRLSRSRCGKH